MANTQSSKKRVRQTERRTARNKAIRSRTRTFEKLAHKALLAGEPEAAREAVTQAVSQLDRAASKGVIHANNAARRKGSLMKRLDSALKAG